MIRLIAHRFSASLLQNSFARFTTWVSILSVALGCLALQIAISVLNGYELTIQRAATSVVSPIEVRAHAGGVLALSPASEQQILSVRGVLRTVPLLRKEALVRTKTQVEGTLINAWNSEDLTRLIKPLIKTGSLPVEGSDQCILGSALQQTLGITIGDTLVVFVANAEKTAPQVLQLIVVGTAQTGIQSVDQASVIMELHGARTLLKSAPEEKTVLGVELSPGASLEDVALQVSNIVVPAAFAETYTQRFSSLLSWIALQREPIPIVLGLLSIVAVFTVMSTLLIAVVEKTPSIAVLQTLGMSQITITAIMLWRAATIGIAGAAIGTTISLCFCYSQATWEYIKLDGSLYYVQSLPISMSPLPFVLIPLFSVVLCLLAAIIPTILALRVRPAKALRFS